MSIQQFEFFHGAVLVKILRNDRPIVLLIETNIDDDRAYKIDDNKVKVLYIKHRLVSRKLSITKKHPKGGRTWQFVFTPQQIDSLRVLKENHKNEDKVFLALVCGYADVKKRMEICIVDLDKYNELLDLNSATQQSITIRCLPGLSFRIMVDNREKYTIPLSLLEDI